MSSIPLLALTGHYCAPHRTRIRDLLTTDWTVKLWTPDQSVDHLHSLLSKAEAVVTGADALLSGRLIGPITQAKHLKLLQIPFSGHDWLKFEMLSSECTACNVYEHHTTIAEYVMANILEWQIELRKIDPNFRTDSWDYGGSAVSGKKHGEVRGKTIGILGYGRIGEQIAKRAKAFDMRIIAVGRSSKPTPKPLDWLGTHAQWPQLIEQSDFLVLTCPLTDSTRGIVDAETLKTMKPSSVIINVARGPVIDEAALYNALKTGTIAGAVLDVWYAYPQPGEATCSPANHPFHELENTILTPHCAGWTDAQDERRWTTIADNLDRLRRGDPLRNIITLN